MSEINLDKILDSLKECQWKLDDTQEAIEEVQEYIKVKEEISDFLYDLYNNQQLPQDIKEKAEVLWKKI